MSHSDAHDSTRLTRPSARFRPWLWPWRLLERLTDPIPPGLWLLNAFCQRVLRINAETPWMVHFSSRVIGRVKIGRNVWKSFALSGGCYIQGLNGVEIGDDTLFAPGVKIVSSNHQPGRLDRQQDGPPIRIGPRCWIGVNAVILPGVELGADSIVGAGAVVTHSVPAGVSVAGVPARPIVAAASPQPPASPLP
jgi:carbonic anhydrase/acetyltransferase-like protein (isoleucine patch superfamily)